MKREEIEQLLADYASGEISAMDMQRLEVCFANDPTLKKEAGELLTIWQALGIEAENQSVDQAPDQAFYALIATEKATLQPKGRVIQISAVWLKSAAAIAACALAFVIGRFTAPFDTAPLVQYKTVYVKQPVQVQPQIATSAPTVSPSVAKAPLQGQTKTSVTEVVNPLLVQQIRSVFASERMAAVSKLADSTQINTANLNMLAIALREDPNPSVRLSIVNALRPISARPKIQQVLIAAMNRQDNCMIQSQIVDLLINARSKQAIPQMMALLDDKHTDSMVQNKIKGGIESFLY